MKIHYQFFVVIFIIVSLFILRDDVMSTVGNITSYLNKDNKIQEVKSEDIKDVLLPTEVGTPGALRVFGSYPNEADNIKLSKSNVVDITNKYRKENGNLPLLIENEKLNLSAEKKLQDMFRNQYFEHVSPNDISVGDLGNQVSYDYILIGENLALGNFKNDTALVGAWMKSEGHRANILNDNYLDIGVAVGKGIYEGKNVWMAVQHFGTPRSACPAVDKVLFGVINLNQIKIKEIEQELIKRRESIDNGTIYEGSTYYEQIEQYNALINPYNNLIQETKQKIDKYNNQIQEFNLCIYGN